MASPDAELKVRIDAELAAGFLTAFKTGAKIPKEFADKVDAELKRAAAAAKRLGDNLGGGLAKGSNQAAFALTNLGRVAQDAPFGFIGIQNNLNPLLESFQQLKKESGSTGAALKALVGGLMGPAGLGIALSIVSAAILFYQQYMQRTKKETVEATDANDDYRKSLKGVASAQLEGTISAQKDLTELKLLYNAYTDNSNSLKVRKEAYEQLQALYPSYFKDLKFEKTASEATATAYKGLTIAILASAKARASSGLIDKNSTTQLINSERILKLNKAIAIVQAQRSDFEKLLASDINEGYIISGQIRDIAKEENALISERRKLVTENNNLTVANLNLEKNINTELEKGGKLTGKIGADTKETAKEVKAIAEVYKEVFGDAKFGDFKSSLPEPFSNLPKIGEGLPAVKQQITDNVLTPFQSLLSEVIPQVKSGFEGFFNDILEKGTFSFAALGKAILNTFTSVLASQATTGLLNLIASAANIGGSTAGGGGVAKNVAGAAGSALPLLAGGSLLSGGALPLILGGIAAGGLIASLFKKKKSDPYLPPASVATSSASNVGSADFSAGRVVFEISGVNLIGVLNRAGQKLQRYNKI